MSEAVSVPALRFPEFEGVWDKTSLSNYARMQGGFAFKSDNFSTVGIPVVRISNISAKSGVVDLTGAVKHPEISGDDSFRISKGDVLIALSGATTGKACIYNLESIAYLNQRVGLLKKSSGNLHYDYLVTLVFSELFSKQLMATLVAGAQPNVSPKDIEKFEFGFPSLPEQKKIAAFLGVVDAKLTALRDRVALLERYKRGLMQALFSQSLRFTRSDGTAFPDWEKKRLGDISTKNDSGVYKSRELYGSGHNIVGVSDLFSMNAIDGQIFRRVPLDDDELAKNTLEEGDILYAESSLVRAGIAKAVYVTAQGAGTAFAWHTRRFSIDSQVAISAFIFYYLESEVARRYIEAVATQTALTGITTKDYFKTPVFLPHPDEQQKIADALSAMDAKIAAVADQVAQMEQFKKGLLQQMFV